MPANLTPDYFKAEKWFKSAATDDERVLALEEMLRVIPKHKGTDHLRADLRKKLSKLKASLEPGAKKGSSKHVDVFHVPRSGAGQLALIGTPNSGKSSIVASLTNAHVHVADYPFTTTVPVPGIAKHEDVPIEFIDTPPITADYAAPGQVNTYRSADLIGIVIDLSTDPLEQMEICVTYLRSHRLMLDNSTDANDPAVIHLARKTFVICTKADLASAGTMQTLIELTDCDLVFIQVSINDLQALAMLTAKVFDLLDIVRIYSKKPHEPADMTDPFTLSAGSTVHDLAFHIHRELAEKLHTARSWNAPGIHDGQNVRSDHVLSDKEIIELHFS
ncbi:MAG: 50S ribosome-binding GTPase [Anaerohalosphaera sp.]|nr:50S ribosome-binding GTPase [Anaerohalosphaera sp.]